MKVIILGPAYPYRGGIANFGEALSQSFTKAGIDNEIITFTLQYPGFLFPGKTQFDSGAAPKGIKISRFISSINPVSWFNASKYIKSQNPDLLIINYWMPFMAPSLGKIARLVQKNSKTKVIAITHNVIPHEKKAGDKQLTNYFINSCDGFITLAKSVLDDIKNFTSNPNAIFIPHPVYDIFGEKISKQEARAFLKLNPDDKILLFFGIIRKYKGLDLLLESLANEKLKNLNINLLIAGEFYEDKEKYTKIINSLNLQNHVIFADHFIPGNEVKYYFCACDIVTQTYHTATQSGVTQIAYHFERPMLVTNVGGLAEIVPDKKVGYITDKNPESIADAIFDFYSYNREEGFSSNTAAEKHRFSWENMVNGILDLYKKL